MRDPKISLCIVVRDGAERLSFCLDSAEPLVSETILIDLSAQDPIADIAKAHEANLIPFDVDRGLTEARNTAIERATGDWILFLEPWETIPKESLTPLKRLCRSHNDTTVYQFLCKRIFSENEFQVYEWAENLGQYGKKQVSQLGYVKLIEIRLFPNKGDIRYDEHDNREMKSDLLIIPRRYKIKFVQQVVITADGPIEMSEDTLTEQEKFEKDLELLRGRQDEKADCEFFDDFNEMASDYLTYASVGLKDFDSLKEGFHLRFGNPSMFNCMMDHLLSAGMFEEGVELYEIVKDRWPDVSIIHNVVGLMFFGLEELDKAEDCLRKAIAIEDQDPNFWENMGKVLLVKGQHKESFECLKTALSLDDSRTHLNAFMARISDKRDKGPTLSVCMIAKDEEEYIGKALDSVLPVADEIIVVDTGSEDRTTEIAEQKGAKVYHHRWRDDFSEARNESLKYAQGDYIFWLDADEYVDRRSIINLMIIKALLPVNKKEAYSLNLTQGKDQERRSRSKVRLFPNRAGIKFEGRVMEGVEESLRENDIQVKHIEGEMIQNAGDHNHERKMRNVPAFKKAYQDHLEPDSYFHGALFFLSIGEAEEALNWLQKAYELGHGQSWYLPVALRLARLHEKLNGQEKVKGIFSDLINRFPKSKVVYGNYMEFLYKTGDQEKALEVVKEFDEAADETFHENMDEEKALFYRAATLIDSGHFQDAEETLGRMLEIDPLSTRAAVGLAYLATMAGDVEGCVLKVGQLAHLINRDYAMEIDSMTDLINMCLSLIEDLREIQKEEEADFLLKVSDRLLEYHAIIHGEKDVKNT